MRLTVQEKLLYNISKQLETLIKMQNENVTHKSVETNKPIEKKKTYTCKHCGKEHERSIDIVNCGRRLKKQKDGAKNVNSKS